MGDSNRSDAVRISRRKPCYRESGTGCTGQRAGGGGNPKQDVEGWNPESPLLRIKKRKRFLI
jgi:hypothetical protein